MSPQKKEPPNTKNMYCDLFFQISSVASISIDNGVVGKNTFSSTYKHDLSSVTTNYFLILYSNNENFSSRLKPAETYLLENVNMSKTFDKKFFILFYK